MEHNWTWTITMVIQVVEFQAEGMKLEIFLAKNQNTQNTENWCSGEVSKSAKILLDKLTTHITITR